jgi:hypothetical protein
MARWRFYQGLRAEWWWYHVDEHGSLVAESDRGFAELQGCMANAEAAGFGGEPFQVYTRSVGFAGEPLQLYTRQTGSFGDTHRVTAAEAVDEMPMPSTSAAVDKQPAT